MMSCKCKHMENIRRVLKRYRGRKVTLLLGQCKRLEDVKIKRVCKDVVLVKRHHCECSYVRICCICAVDPKCECCHCHSHCHHHEHDCGCKEDCC